MRGDGIKIEPRHSMKILELERLLNETHGKLNKHIERSNIETKKLKKDLFMFKLMALFCFIIAWVLLVWFVTSWSIVPNTHLTNATHVNNVVKDLLHK